MKKDEQVKINNEVMCSFYNLSREYDVQDKPVRLNRCHAYVRETEKYYVLISYKTLVAFIDKETRICYDILRYNYDYTNTSTQHIAKFRKSYGAVDTLTYRPVKGICHD